MSRVPSRCLKAVLSAALALALPGQGALAAAPPVQATEPIRAAARAILAAQLGPEPAGERREIAVSAVDRRLRLAACQTRLEAELAPGARLSGRTTVRVSCPQPAWRIHVSAEIQRFAPVVVARDTLPRGEPIRAGQVMLAERELSRLPYGYLRSLDQALGRLPERPISAGRALTPNQVAAPELVRRGERVTITSTDQGFAVHMSGEALEGAARGDRVRVRALGSKRVIEATVVERGQVQAL